MNAVRVAVWIALLAGMAAAAVKYVAVVEMEIDMNPGEAAKLEMSEVRLLTDELREKAVNNLPQGQYSVMTTETIMAQSGSVLSECFEENCIITLGSRIGADYIVRGKLGKFQSLFTLSAVIYDTENGFLVASAKAVRSERMTELLEKASAVCEEMYKKFASEHGSAEIYAITVTADPPEGGYVSRNPDQTYYAPETNVNLLAVPADGYAFTGWSGDTTATADLLTVTVNGDKTLTANFEYIQRKYILLTYIYPLGGGRIIRNPDKVSYAPGENVSVTAVAEDGYTFIGWTGAVTSRGNRVTSAINGDMTLTASFYRQSVTRPAQYAYETIEAKRKPMTGFSLGSGGLSDAEYVAQFGMVHSRPLGKRWSFNMEANFLAGKVSFDYDDYESIDYYGNNFPQTFLLQLSVFSFEAGAYEEFIFGDARPLFNAGFVAGAGIGFSEKKSRRYFYRYSGGYRYWTHLIGMRWLF
jgi:uncharacterized repeat protein (TIGR02543 family)